MKITFWNGSEFKGTASPSCEVLTRNWRIKLLLIGKSKIHWLTIERLNKQVRVPAWRYYDTPNPGIRLCWIENGTPYLFESKTNLPPKSVIIKEVHD